ncbi:MAG TPA: hypothetical protein VFT29_13610 [Gemmatimonadaceae bacterium]|nr:hypothetical protein [Gemmatimonadaceae bacterium]
MDDRSMRRYVPVLVAGAALIAAACSEPAAPTVAAARPELAELSAVLVEPAKMWGYQTAGTYTFTLSPSGGYAKIGAYTLKYDANAVCDPATSSYGPSEWYKSCSTLTTPITITAKFWSEDGRTYADFSPDIRFEPSKRVRLSTNVPSLKGLELNDDIRQQFIVFYTRVQDGLRYSYDEAASDPSLSTYFGTYYGHLTGYVSRKVLHFSGYYVRSGRACDESGGECSDGSIEAAVDIQ